MKMEGMEIIIAEDSIEEVIDRGDQLRESWIRGSPSSRAM